MLSHFWMDGWMDNRWVHRSWMMDNGWRDGWVMDDGLSFEVYDEWRDHGWMISVF